MCATKHISVKSLTLSQPNQNSNRYLNDPFFIMISDYVKQKLPNMYTIIHTQRT